MRPAMSERSTALVGTWAAVNHIACTTEDTIAIRAMIGEAGIAPGVWLTLDGAEVPWSLSWASDEEVPA